jgi:hypothetical protein
MKNLTATLCLTIIMLFGVAGVTDSGAEPSGRVEVYLANQLDDSRGFCLDVKGYKQKARVDRGLQAHTCYSYQGNIAVDQGFDPLKLSKNQFFLPAFEVCMEAVSLTRSANVRLSECRNENLQKFELNKSGRIHPTGNLKLCLTVAQGQSKQGGGGSPLHLKRNLSLEACRNSLSDFQIWNVRKIN